MKKILIATKNKGKIKEFKEMLTPLGYEVQSLLDLKEEIEIEETGTTFEENAYIKAKAIYDLYHCDVISDDSGLCIDFFEGGPGVYSARWLGVDTSYDYKNNYILDKMKDSKDRKAQYVCCIAHINEEGSHEIYRGECIGEIALKPEGSNGFGYDPIFYYPPYQTTLANVSEEDKNTISHRGIALEKLLEGMSK